MPALPGLFDETTGPPPNAATRPRLNARFTALARRVVHHASEQRWARLYRVLWRLTTEDPHLLDIDVDEDVAVLRVMERQVRREAHCMKAFVRFRHVVGDDDHEWFIAWYRAGHPVLPLVTPFFVERFRVLRWAILTPFGSARWDREQLGPTARVNELRGRICASEWARRVVVAVHPSACLRASDDVERARLFAMLVDDLRVSAATA